MREPFWWGDGAAAQSLRWLTSPLAAAWWAASKVRNLVYDVGLAPMGRSGIPVVSVGNVTVGGTGKTPVAAWIAHALSQRGMAPGIVLRGYGQDESLVHQLLTPNAVVVADPDRVRGIAAARAAGATVAILDDGHQHRRAARDLNLVLVSADVPWPTWPLPMGPLRESWADGLGRADLVLVTVKAATDEQVAATVEAVRRRGGSRVAVLRLTLDRLHRVGGQEARALGALEGLRILAVSGIASPAPFHRQLQATGAAVETLVFGDHHAFQPSDVERIVARARGADFVVCTLKDAVKLQGSWPQSGPGLWYVSQRVEPIAGVAEIEAALARVCSRPDTPHT
ncbi:MAG: tetraacyldisaccharide 4'-kinase [Gemmatimonadetes bacterium]|nr:tetraacyldisaccharide 4'-kinase [Gemmatimonadota bacterium]